MSSRQRLGEALNDAGWDGGWYRRAYYDDGTPLGSAPRDECRIDAIAQAWSVLSGAAPAERAEMALDAMEQHLVSENDELIRLLTPRLRQNAARPRLHQGLPARRARERRAVHARRAVGRARARGDRPHGARDEAARDAESDHARRTPEEVDVYRVEPYVIAADVYGVAPHVGRGGWTWYTGSAGWMYRVALESLLGLTIVGGDQSGAAAVRAGELAWVQRADAARATGGRATRSCSRARRRA